MVLSDLLFSSRAGYNFHVIKSLFTMALAAATLPLQAGVVDVSTSNSVFVHTGDTLTFELSVSSYSLHAQAFGLPPYPETLQFALVTAPLSVPGQFSATLSSPDASDNVAFDAPLSFTAGHFSSAGYQGTVDTLHGQVQLQAQTAQDLFGGGKVQLHLINLGGNLTLGLPSLLLGQDLFATLSGGPLSVGVRVGSVTLDRPNSLLVRSFSFAAAAPAAFGTPEPDTAWLLAAGGILLCAFSSLLARLSRARR